MFRTPAKSPRETATGQPGSLSLERNARVFASDGPVGVLRQLVVDESSGEISLLVIAPEDGSPPILVPAGLLQRSAGSALFLSVSRSQFARAAARAARFDKAGFQPANFKRAIRAGGRAAATALPMLRTACRDAATASLPDADTPPLSQGAAALPPVAAHPAGNGRRLAAIRLPGRHASDRPALAATGD
ncbi:MAG: hypothetical protein ACKOWF_11140 [Chloroflexota bacterium]